MNPNFQSLFPLLTWRAYLNHASLTPPSTRVIEAMETMVRHYAGQGVNAWREGAACRRRVREKLALLVGTRAEDLGLVQNTSHGLMVVANEYPWQPNDCLILFRGEFPGNAVPWLAAAERYGLEVLWLELEDLVAERPALLEAMARKPRLMAVSWVQYQTGMALDLAALSRLRSRFGVHICLDAIQGLGPLMLDLRQTPLDFVACGGHKWLMAPEGTGFLYVHPNQMETLRPVMVSWLSQEEPATFLYMGSGQVDYHKPIRKEASRYEMGTINNIGYAGMEAALDLILEVGPGEVSYRALHLAGRVRAGLERLNLKPATPETASANVCVALPTPQLQNHARLLEQQGIAIATPDGHLRASPHFYNDEGDVDLFLESLEAIMKEHPHPGNT